MTRTRHIPNRFAPGVGLDPDRAAPDAIPEPIDRWDAITDIALVMQGRHDG